MAFCVVGVLFMVSLVLGCRAMIRSLEDLVNKDDHDAV